jgi:hypothetical protein
MLNYKFIRCYSIGFFSTFISCTNVSPLSTGCRTLGTDHLIFHGGGAEIRKKYRACLEWMKKKSNITNTRKKIYRAQKNSKLAILYIERKIQFPWVFFLLIVSVPPWLTIPEVYMQNTNRYKPVLITLTSIIQLSTNYLNGIPKNPNLNTESPTLL